MLNQNETTRPLPIPQSDIGAISARLSGLSEVALCPDCEPVVAALAADIAELLGDVARLSGAVLVARREAANRLAAIRAALGAESDGEPDPLGFLRDELADPAAGQLPGQSRGWWR